MKSPEPLEYGCRASGRFTNICVIDSRTGEVVRRHPDQDNLILDVGMDGIASNSWASRLDYGVAGTGTTDTREAVTGSYSQSGTTVTRASGSRDFTAADVGKLIRFASGEESRISAYTNATTVTVVESRTVGATSITLYHVNQLRLATEVKRSNTYPTFDFSDGSASQTTLQDAANAKVTLRRTYDFTAESGSVTYTEIGVSGGGAGSAPAGTFSQSGTTVTRTSGAGTFSAGDVGKVIRFSTGELAVITVYTNTTTVTVDRSQTVSATTITLEFPLFSRIKLAEPIALVADQQLRFTYNLTIRIGGVPGVTDATADGDSVGWPIDYSITNVTTNGTKMVVTTSEAHHYVVGGKVNLVGLVMPRTAITAASSTVSDFTITAPGHGKSAGNSIVIQGVTPAAYNGTFVVASVSGDDITVTSALNPGTGTVFGTVRLANPSPWFDGEWTVAAVPTSTTFEVTTAITPPTPQLPEGIVRNNVKRKFVAVKWGVTPIGIASGNARYHFDGRYDMQSEVYQHNFFDGTTLAMHLTAHTTQPTTLPTVFPVHWIGTNANNAAGSSVQTVSNGQMNTSGSNLLVHLEGTQQSYSNGSFLRDTVFVIAAGSGNRTNHKFFAVGRNVVDSFRTGQVCAYFLFEELQKKDSVHKLTFTIRRRWARDLSAEP